MQQMVKPNNTYFIMWLYDLVVCLFAGNVGDKLL